MNSNSSVNSRMECQTTFDFYKILVSIISCGYAVVTKATALILAIPHKYPSSSLFYLCALMPVTTIQSTPSPTFGIQNIFVCDENSQCESETLICADNQDCYVHCTAPNACRYGKIVAPTTGMLTVYCNGERACDTTTICGTTEGPLGGTVKVECAAGHLACHNTLIFCPHYGFCEVDCGVFTVLSTDDRCQSITVDAGNTVTGNLLVHGTGQDASVTCPGGINECIVECSDYACRDSVFQAQADTAKLQITASGTFALKNAKIYCPSGDGLCLINVSGEGPEILSHCELYSINGFNGITLTCNYATESFPNCYDIDNPPKLLCTQNYQQKCNIELVPGTIEDWQCSEVNSAVLCQEDNIDGYYGNYLMCNEVGECQGMTLYCNENEDCYVYCLNAYACQLATIHGPTNGNLYVNCASQGQEACLDIDIHCPEYGSCDVDCGAFGETDCRFIFVDATNVINGSLSVHAAGHYGEVECPGNDNECIIECSESGCRDSTFTAQADTAKLQITSFGSNALTDSKIYCPSTSGECVIHTIGAGPDMLSGTDIYSVNGFADVSLFCNYTTTVADCYNISTPPHLYCTPGLTQTCPFELTAGFKNQWQCLLGIDSADLCQWTYAPTTAATFVPTHFTSNPTNSPTNFPTNTPTHFPTNGATLSPTNPTSGPTIDPTGTPSSNPTYSPTTMHPTTIPTVAPIINPTNQPTTSPTNNPTETTNDPTKYPTANPTQATSQPTIAPTSAQTPDPTAYPTQAPTDMDVNGDSDDFTGNVMSGNAESLWWIWVVVILVIAVSVCVCFACYEYRKFQKAKWINSPSSSAVSSRSPNSCASNFSVGIDGNMCQQACDAKETELQIEKWANEAPRHLGHHSIKSTVTNINNITIMYSDDGPGTK